MMIRIVVSVLVLALGSVAARGEDVRERLQMLEGDWTLEGREATFRETCAWFPRRSHMVCNSESHGKSGVRNGVSVMSYADEKQRFVYYHYGSSGVVQALDLFLEEGVLRATGERLVGTDLIRTQVSMVRRADGSFDFHEQESKNAGPWESTARLHYVRRSAPTADTSR